ncbi:MAG: ribose-phosphate diphosphokinase [Aurantibacter sp.]
MTSSIICLPGYEYLGKLLLENFPGERVEFTISEFPDGETYLRVHTPVDQRIVFIVGSLNQPNSKILPLIYLSSKLREMGASQLVLVTPYLPYMRQDVEFLSGECVTSRYFASLLSDYIDHLITIDPHLHRHHSLDDIYHVSNQCLHTAPLIAEWVNSQVPKPLVLGPDSESKQWVEEIAAIGDIPYQIFEKQRLGDDRVIIEKLDLSLFRECTPVVVDDIISTAGTMSAILEHLKVQSNKKSLCLAIHAVFSANAYAKLKDLGALDIVTTNSIKHESNKIDISPLLISAMLQFMDSMDDRESHRN